MLERSDTSISDALKAFNACDIEVGLLVPTKTGMEKSIMDATASLRDFLRDTGVHHYDAQPKGQEAKVNKRIFYLRSDSIEEATASLYRPETKNGDPRIWLRGLKRYAAPFNLLAILVEAGDIYIVNCSAPGLLQTLNDPSTPLGAIAARRRKVNPAATELLELLQTVARKGFVRTLRAGATGVGMTLETLLDISANASRAPDYKGIEIKAKRLGAGQDSRSTLFSQKPDWKLSPVGSAWNLLSRYGYQRDGKLKLYHEMNAKKPNSIGFMLEIDILCDWLKQSHRKPASGKADHLVTWQLETLRARLLEKHAETFWVGAKYRGTRDAEEFHYVRVRHTRAPNIRNFDTLLEGGLISVDYTMSQKTPGRQTVRDHGYLFKIHAHDLDALFPPSSTYMLE